MTDGKVYRMLLEAARILAGCHAYATPIQLETELFTLADTYSREISKFVADEIGVDMTTEQFAAFAKSRAD